MPAKSYSFNPSYIILLVLSVGAAFAIANFGHTAGYLVIAAILGTVFSLCCILFPVFGFYLTIAVSFVISDVERILDIESLTYLGDILIVATFIGVVFKKIKDKEFFWKYCNHPIIYAYLVYILYTLLQLFNPNLDNHTLVLLMVRKFFILLMFYYSCIQLFTDWKSIRRFFIFWLIISTVIALYGCYQEWFGLQQFELDFIYSNPLLVGLYKLDNGDFRKFSSMADPKAYGLLMAASALIPLVFLLKLKNTAKRRVGLLVSIVILLLGMSYSGTRTANFMLVMAIVLYILMTASDKKTLIFTGVAGFIFMFILYAPIYGNVTINRIRSTFDVSTDASLQVRDINRHNIQPYIYSHPIGGGLGTTGILNMKENPNHPLSGFPTDSGFLQAALELGWVGLLIQCCVYFVILQQGIHAYFNSNNSKHKTLLLAAIISIFSYVVAQYAQVSIGAAPGIFLFYGMIATIIRLPQLELET